MILMLWTNNKDAILKKSLEIFVWLLLSAWNLHGGNEYYANTDNLGGGRSTYKI